MISPYIWRQFFSWDEGACYAPKEIWNSMMLVHWGNTNSKHNHSTTAYWADNWDSIPSNRRGNHPCFHPDKDLVLPAWKRPDGVALSSKLWARYTFHWKHWIIFFFLIFLAWLHNADLFQNFLTCQWKMSLSMIHFQATREAKGTVLLQWKSRAGLPKWKARRFVSWLKCYSGNFKWSSWFQMTCGNLSGVSKLANFIFAISFSTPSCYFFLPFKHIKLYILKNLNLHFLLPI